MTRRNFIAGVGAGVIGSALPIGCRTRRMPEDSVRLVQMGDPQLGFGVSMKGAVAYAEDLKRFEAAIERVNDLKPDAVVVMGDLVHHAEDLTRDWPRLLRRFTAPVVVPPGNHDLGNRVSQAALNQFRRVVGSDRLAMDVKGWRLVSGNSQLWFSTDLTDEVRAYEDWIGAERARACASAGRVILATHYPPFELYLGEADSPRNCPKSRRIASVDAWLESGARFWLAGHTHTMLSRAHKGLVLLNAETTCRNFDARPFGFRLLTVRTDLSWSWDFYSV